MTLSDASGTSCACPRVARTLIVIAALAGAAGVALAAMGAHGGSASGRYASASSMLLFHAAAALGVIAVSSRGLAHSVVALIAAAGLLAGSALFAGALIKTELTGLSLFPMAAPTGGSLTILSWLVLAVAALWPQRGGAQ